MPAVAAGAGVTVVGAVAAGGGVAGTSEADSSFFPQAVNASTAASDTATHRGWAIIFMRASHTSALAGHLQPLTDAALCRLGSRAAVRAEALLPHIRVPLPRTTVSLGK